MLNRSWPFVTKSPSLKCTLHSWPEICALMLTAEMVSTLPIACSVTGMVREATVATVTGAPGAWGLAACTSFLPLQPARTAAKTRARITCGMWSVFIFGFFPAANVMTRRPFGLDASRRFLHASQPDARQRVRGLLQIKLLILFAAE